MNSPWVMGISAGALSVLIFLISASGSVLTAPLIYASPLPLVVAGLGWGWTSSLTGAVLAIGLAGLMTGALGAAVYALSAAVGPVWLSRQALMGNGSGGDAPSGQLLVWATALAALLFGLCAIWFSQYEGGLQGQLEIAVTAVPLDLEGIIGRFEASGVEISREQFISVFSAMIPAAMALIWVMALLANLLVGQTIVERLGRAQRGRFEIAKLELPKGLGLILLVLAAAAFFSGNVGFIASTLAAVFILPFFLTGLITVHVMTNVWANRDAEKAAGFRGLRKGLLVGFYIMLLVWGLLPLLVCALGFIDQWRGLRRNALAVAPHQGE